MVHEHDPEPERYYDWILWKLRQERKMEQDDPMDDITKDGKLRRIPNYIEKKNIQNILIDDYEFTEVNAKKLAYVLEKLFIYYNTVFFFWPHYCTGG